MTPPDSPKPPEPPPGKPPRRPRYAGTHPRQFGEKYKERDAARHPEEVAKVIASGKTPAGAHRPIMVREVLKALAPKPGDVGVDATLGSGGHALELLRLVAPSGRLIGLDTDPFELPRAEARIREAGFGDEAFAAVHSNFAALPKVLAARGIDGANFVLADLGCSSMQLDDPSRGFSYKNDGPLDLRMNPTRGLSAAELIAKLSAEEIEEMLRESADEPRARAISVAIVAAREKKPLRTTAQLSAAVSAGMLRGADARASLARIFQALRIAVNEEYATLDAFLRALPYCVAPGGRVAILSFHSGEDRRVKQSFRDGERAGLYDEVAKDVIRPSREEIGANPRASSAKLRWARLPPPPEA